MVVGSVAHEFGARRHVCHVCHVGRRRFAGVHGERLQVREKCRVLDSQVGELVPSRVGEVQCSRKKSKRRQSMERGCRAALVS